MSSSLFRAAVLALAAALLALPACRPASGRHDEAAGQPGRGDKKGDEKQTPQGTPVLWQEQRDAASLDLLLGPGGEGMRPDLSRVVWEGTEDDGGYSVKWRVRDGSGRKWVVKVGNEAQPETAASRLVWAAGYPVEVNYLAPCVRVADAPRPRKEVERCGGDGYANARFEARPENYKRLGEWAWNRNPFSGTKEFAGLVVLMGLVNNWDLKDSNNKIIYVPGEGGGGSGQLRYVVSDLGATFGQTGNFITHSRNEPEKYVRTGFVERVEGGRVVFDYGGKNGGLFDAVTVEQAKWVGDVLGRLSGEQIRDAFRAANYKPEQVEALAQEVSGRIDALRGLPGPEAAAGKTAP